LIVTWAGAFYYDDTFSELAAVSYNIVEQLIYF